MFFVKPVPEGPQRCIGWLNIYSKIIVYRNTSNVLLEVIEVLPIWQTEILAFPFCAWQPLGVLGFALRINNCYCEIATFGVALSCCTLPFIFLMLLWTRNGPIRS